MIRTLLLGMATVVLLCACGTSAPATRPADFAISYNWREGTVPPPYYYSYTITISPAGAGSMELVPSYTTDGVPVFRESFTLDAAQLDALYARLRESGMFTTSWRTLEMGPVGGSNQDLTVVASGSTARVADYVVPEQENAATTIFAAVNAAVPADLRARLIAQREAFVAANGG